jgi:acetylornithine deacetylase/succinyl-diaminopimelate desuccinylase-like protein
VSAQDLAPAVLQRTIELAAIPAPTGAEQARADLVHRWWDEDGWAPRTDAVGNVWAQVTGGPGPGLLVCAHLDTVFPADVPHKVTVTPGRLSGPSVGDDSVGVAALSAVARLLRPGPDTGPGAGTGAGPDAGPDAGPGAGTGAGPVWLVATVGEEGMGNLTGIRHALGHAPQPVSAVIAVEGNYLGRVVITGVGSVRWRVRYSGPGGHAWERADAPSAVHAAAGGAARLAALVGRPAAGARCTVNVGLIGGGEAINARAREAWFDVDLRGDGKQALARLEKRASGIVFAVPPGISVDVEELGRRPAGSVAPASPIARAAVTALRQAGLPHQFRAASTDANAALDMGIPAVALGVTRGEGEHTPQEWIETAPVPDGLTALAATIDLLREAYA